MSEARFEVCFDEADEDNYTGIGQWVVIEWTRWTPSVRSGHNVWKSEWTVFTDTHAEKEAREVCAVLQEAYNRECFEVLG